MRALLFISLGLCGVLVVLLCYVAEGLKTEEEAKLQVVDAMGKLLWERPMDTIKIVVHRHIHKVDTMYIYHQNGSNEIININN